jgi:pyruvate/2-oxoglutarate dehydrogenase complex dihydrolipoamide acyltransferase (E2) component
VPVVRNADARPLAKVVIRRPVVHADQLTLRRVCTLSLTFDHRVTDGVPAARLLEPMARFMADEVQLDGLV